MCFIMRLFHFCETNVSMFQRFNVSTIQRNTGYDIMLEETRIAIWLECALSSAQNLPESE